MSDENHRGGTAVTNDRDGTVERLAVTSFERALNKADFDQLDADGLVQLSKFLIEESRRFRGAK